MKNIQRFKFPMIIAAGLHGALLLSLPGDALPPPIINKPLQPLVTSCWPEEIIRITEPEDENTGALRPAGGKSVPEIPDIPLMPPDRTTFTIPVKPVVPVVRLNPEMHEVPSIRGDGENEWPGGKERNPVFDPHMLDRVPRATVQSPPDYPVALRRDGVRGTVMVEFTVNTEGQVVGAEILHATHRELVEPTRRAVLKWRFEPGRRAGQAVPFRMVVPVEFAPGVGE